MKTLRVLLVEDEPLAAMDLEETIHDIVPAVVIIKTSVAETLKVLPEAFDFAFLDVDVTNGKTYEVAHALSDKHVPFAFVSGSVRAHLPDVLQSAPFIPKPFDPKAIERILRTLDT